LILGGGTVDDGGHQQVDGHSGASTVHPVVVAFAVEGGSATEEVQEHVLNDLGAAHAGDIGSVLGLGVDQLGQHLGNAVVVGGVVDGRDVVVETSGLGVATQQPNKYRLDFLLGRVSVAKNTHCGVLHVV